MTNEIASLTELADRLDWTLSEDELRVARSALEDLSDDARYYGRSTWTAETAPRMVRRLVLAAAQRFMRNPEGYTQSRAGDETVVWKEAPGTSGDPKFDDAEIAQLRAMSGRTPGLRSAPITAYRSTYPVDPRAVGLVPTDYAVPFPLFASDEDNW